jgi:hypothetical protein
VQPLRVRVTGVQPAAVPALPSTPLTSGVVGNVTVVVEAPPLTATVHVEAVSEPEKVMVPELVLAARTCGTTAATPTAVSKAAVSKVFFIGFP